MVKYEDELNTHEITLSELTDTIVTHVDKVINRCGNIVYYIQFSNGSILTATDGEYGDDAFSFLDGGIDERDEVVEL